LSQLIGSIIAFFGIIASFFVLGSVASIAASSAGATGYTALSHTPARRLAPLFAFALLFALYLSWAYLCWLVADSLALHQLANRWVLLFGAAALAGAPYHWALRSKRTEAASRTPENDPLASPLQYAGGLQSKVVVGGMLTGIYYDWWQGLAG